jgi:hypothetical protein
MEYYITHAGFIQISGESKGFHTDMVQLQVQHIPGLYASSVQYRHQVHSTYLHYTAPSSVIPFRTDSGIQRGLQMDSTLQTQCPENSEQTFHEMKLRSLVPNFYIAHRNMNVEIGNEAAQFHF